MKNQLTSQKKNLDKLQTRLMQSQKRGTRQVLDSFHKELNQTLVSNDKRKHGRNEKRRHQTNPRRKSNDQTSLQ